MDGFLELLSLDFRALGYGGLPYVLPLYRSALVTP